MSHNVRQHLQLGNDDYDVAIRRFIPGYSQMLAGAAGAVARAKPELVLDLGAGTGALSEVILACPDVGLVELLDVDPEMMDSARIRLERFGNRTRFTMQSFNDPLNRCDAVAASLSLHHIPTLAAKQVLFKHVFDALGPGGVFANGDVNMPADDNERNLLYRDWANHLVANGIPETRAWQYFDEWAGEDTYLPLEDEIAALERIGFKSECVWREGPVGVVVARKPG